MSKTYTIKEIEQLKTRAEDATRQHAEATGQTTALADQLKKEHGIKGATPEAVLQNTDKALDASEARGKKLGEALNEEAAQVEEALEGVG